MGIGLVEEKILRMAHNLCAVCFFFQTKENFGLFVSEWEGLSVNYLSVLHYISETNLKTLYT